MKPIKRKLGKVSITVEKDYWSDQRSYDRLVVVEVANVGCFLSRKFVPEGIQYTDREYWIKFGNVYGGGGGDTIEVVTDFGNSISGYTGGKVLYIGGVMTRAHNGMVINALKTRLNKTEGTNFFRVVVDNLTGGILKDYADGTTHFPDGFPEISKYDTIIIQIDTFEETVGTASDFPATGNVEGLYANTVYGQYMYFVDKLRSLKKNVSIVFVAAPDIAHTDEEAGYKPYAIKEVAKLSGAMYVNCFNFRYGSTWTSTIEVDGTPKVVLGDTSVFSLALFSYWGHSIANKILLCNYIP